MNYRIWKARERDYEKLIPIFQEVNELHVKNVRDYFTSVYYPILKSEYLELLKDENNVVVIIGDASNIFGVAVMMIRESGYFNIMKRRKYAYIADFAISSKFQKKGYGKALFAECVKIAKLKKVDSIELDVWEFNHGAIKFYTSLGMKTLNHRMMLKL